MCVTIQRLCCVHCRPSTWHADSPGPLRGSARREISMKTIAVQAFGLDNLHIIDRPEPKLGFGQVLLKMKAWSLNYRDLLVAKGLYNPKLKLPFVPLSDGVGEVIGVGDGVTRVKVGERVAG